MFLGLVFHAFGVKKGAGKKGARKKKIIMQPIKKKKSRKLFKFVRVLLSASVERDGVSRMRIFLKVLRGLTSFEV